MNLFLYALVAIILVFAFLFFFYVGKWVDRKRNTTENIVISNLPAEIIKLHRSLVIADWHADNLLWDRDPLNRLQRGHVDIPRLIEGNVALQVFDAVIKSPRGQNYHENRGNSDNITLLAMANRWPARTWFSLAERAIHQSDIIHRAEQRSFGQLKIIINASGLSEFLESRQKFPEQVAGILAIEGLHALERDIGNLQRFYRAGYRIMGLTHFFDNAIGGSSSGVDGQGLTDFGKEVVRRMNELSIIIDLAHASSALINDVIKISSKPVIVSHTGVKAVHESPRNLSDDEIRMIAQKGGVIGIGYWDGALGLDIKPDNIVRSIRHIVDVAGIEHVSLGSDFDGSTHTYFDSSQMIVLTQALVEAGFSEKDIALIMGMNQVNFLLENLPRH